MILVTHTSRVHSGMIAFLPRVPYFAPTKKIGALAQLSEAVGKIISDLVKVTRKC